MRVREREEAKGGTTANSFFSGLRGNERQEQPVQGSGIGPTCGGWVLLAPSSPFQGEPCRRVLLAKMLQSEQKDTGHPLHIPLHPADLNPIRFCQWTLSPSQGILPIPALCERLSSGGRRTEGFGQSCGSFASSNHVICFVSLQANEWSYKRRRKEPSSYGCLGSFSPTSWSQEVHLEKQKEPFSEAELLTPAALTAVSVSAVSTVFDTARLFFGLNANAVVQRTVPGKATLAKPPGESPEKKRGDSN